MPCKTITVWLNDTTLALDNSFCFRRKEEYKK